MIVLSVKVFGGGGVLLTVSSSRSFSSPLRLLWMKALALLDLDILILANLAFWVWEEKVIESNKVGVRQQKMINALFTGEHIGGGGFYYSPPFLFWICRCRDVLTSARPKTHKRQHQWLTEAGEKAAVCMPDQKMAVYAPGCITHSSLIMGYPLSPPNTAVQ